MEEHVEWEKCKEKKKKKVLNENIYEKKERKIVNMREILISFIWRMKKIYIWQNREIKV